MRKIILAVVIASSSLLSASYALNAPVQGFEHEVKPANKEPCLTEEFKHRCGIGTPYMDWIKISE
jgi:hypothetical protein